ncbi:hypothetical protein [Kineosporia babensis]|uniref:SAM-dependent methyltransferase n=1 Tax=Kineosporia babensis TaxID=499548 RepID=A0A9X1NCD6_9ACTN|nr:hypothetical protein [Kineosporia babensis]MCD5311179.1 hypothetical protein [Kineosporia babensis]
MQRKVSALVADGDHKRLKSYLQELSRPAPRMPDHSKSQRVRVQDAVQRHMLLEAVKQAATAHESGVSQGKLRLGKVNGTVLQRLLFEEGLRRRAVSYPLFRLAWPMLSQRQRLMPLVRDRGLYCFYSAPLLDAIARLVHGRAAVEIAAGDGALTRLLKRRFVDITATDDYSWDSTVAFDPLVQRQEATAALRARKPEVVICSWPPPQNSFEAKVFTTASVQTYIVLTARAESEAGNWSAYRKQSAFTWGEDRKLSKLVLPPGSGQVLVFQRAT